VELYLHSPYVFMVWCLVTRMRNFTSLCHSFSNTVICPFIQDGAFCQISTICTWCWSLSVTLHVSLHWIQFRHPLITLSSCVLLFMYFKTCLLKHVRKWFVYGDIFCSVICSVRTDDRIVCAHFHGCMFFPFAYTFITVCSYCDSYETLTICRRQKQKQPPRSPCD